MFQQLGTVTAYMKPLIWRWVMINFAAKIYFIWYDLIKSLVDNNSKMPSTTLQIPYQWCYFFSNSVFGPQIYFIYIKLLNTTLLQQKLNKNCHTNPLNRFNSAKSLILMMMIKVMFVIKSMTIVLPYLLSCRNMSSQYTGHFILQW